MRLIIVRHAESVANVQGNLQGQSPGELSSRGLTQARHLAARLKNLPFDRIIASDLKRAHDTAAIIAEVTGAPLELSPALREWRIGQLDGQPAASLTEALRQAGQPLAEFRPEGGESLSDLRQRAASFLNQLLQNHNHETILILSHGDFIRMLLGIMLHQGIEQANSRHLANTSVSILNLNGSQQWAVETLNNTDHLTEP